MILLLSLCTSVFAQERGARGDDAAFAGADEALVPPPRTRLWYSNATFVRANPLGLIDVFKLGVRQRLTKRTSLLWNDTYFFVGTNVLLTPAYTRVGAYAEVQPIALFRAFAGISPVGYYGTFDQVLTFDPSDRYSDRTLSSRDDAQAELGWVFTGGATLRAKAGPIAVRSTLQFTRYDLGLADGAYFYDQYWDRLAPDRGWMALNDADLLYVQGKLRAGARHTWSETFDGSDGTDAALAHHRLGPLFAWQFADEPPGAKVNQPTMFVLAQWWLQHPYRTGDEQPAGLPLIAVGFAFNGDLKTWGSAP